MTSATNAIEQAPLGIAVFDGPDRRLVFANEHWRSLFGYSRPCGTSCDDIIGATFVERIDAVAGDGITVSFRCARVGRPDGVIITVLKAMRSSDQRIAGVIACCVEHDHPIAVALTSSSEDRDALARAEQTSRMKDQFLAMVSHELRAPVTTLLLWERLLRESTTDVARERALDAIHQSAETQARLVSDLLDFARAANGKLNVALHPVALGALLESAVTAAAAITGPRGIAIHAMIDPELGLVRGDAARLRQIVDNLLSNAINASSAGDDISVVARRTPKQILVEVVDRGRGISSQLLPHVFEAFRQGDAVPADGGLGLGLAIAYELASLHEGTLTAHSAGAGTGACFTLALPVHELPAAAGITATPSRTLEAVHVLIVDDDARLLEALQLLLARAGAHVTTASSAHAGWVEIAQHRPDVLVSDIAMPVEDGYQFLTRIRGAEAELARLPAIALTAHASESDRERARAVGYDLHLAKPIDVEKLVASIAKLASAR